jgi:hypothetical protein
MDIQTSLKCRELTSKAVDKELSDFGAGKSTIILA